jgi:hypothetical protein
LLALKQVKAIYFLVLCFLLLIVGTVFQLKQVSAVQVVSGYADTDPLNEYDLDGAKIFITLTNEQFKSGITSADFELVNGPTSLTIQSVQRIDSLHVELTLSNNFTNLTVDYPSFFVRVNSSATVSGGVFETNQIPIYYESEPSDMIMASPQPRPLTEGNLNGAVIRLYVSDGDKFHNDASQKLNGFQLVNAPPGLSVASFSGDGTRIGYITLAYDGTDFDSDFSNFRILLEGEPNDGDGIPGVWYNSSDEMSDAIPIRAVDESSQSASMISSPSSLSETNLDGSTITVSISGDVFQYNIFDSSFFILNNAPTGTAISNIERLADNNARITLSYSGDFDNDITNFSITVTDNALTGDTPLTTSSTTITAYVENPVTMTATTIPSTLYENNLDRSHAILTLNQDKFKSTISPADIQLNNAPPGLTVLGVTRRNEYEAEVTFAFDGTDFDEDVTNVSFNVLSSGLVSAPSASSNTITIKSIVEIEGLTNYIAKGNAYPTNIEMSGYNAKEKELHINSRLYTNLSVSGKKATFQYFITVYDGNGTTIGNYGDIHSPFSITGQTDSQSVELKDVVIILTQDFPTDYRIVITIASIVVS